MAKYWSWNVPRKPKMGVGLGQTTSCSIVVRTGGPLLSLAVATPSFLYQYNPLLVTVLADAISLEESCIVPEQLEGLSSIMLIR